MKLIACFVFLFLYSPLGISKNLERDAALKEIKNTFGLVPKFYAEYPEDGVAGAWEEMKMLQLNPKTALNGLEKELIGLGVAAQIPCNYCGYFHKQAAKLNGGTDNQIKEAIAEAAISRFWATILNGMQVDFKELKAEIDKMNIFIKKTMEPGYKAPAPVVITDADSVYKDMENQMGLVPSFVRKFPKASLPGAWKAIKGVEMNNSALTPKLKSLISLAVGSQIPCKYCIYWDTENAKVAGATDQEIAEAVEMAGTTRHWSTWLNGNRFNEKEFFKEADKIFAHLKKQTGKQ